MRREPRKLKYEFKRSVCIGLALFLFVVIGAGAPVLNHHQNRDRILKFKAVKVAQKRLGLNKVCVSAGGEGTMLRWAATFFVIAIVAALFGFTRIAGSAMDIAKILFFIFLVLAIIIFIFGRTRFV